jgi:hypothetical protein
VTNNTACFPWLRRHGHSVHGGDAASTGARWSRRGLEKGAKARPCPYGRDARVLGCTCASSVARTGACTRAHTRRSTRCGGNGRRSVLPQKGKEKTRRAARALTRAAAPARTIPAWHEGQLHQRQRGGAGQRRVPPRREGRGIHMRRETIVLTLVATGRSAGASVKSGGAAGSARKKRRQTAARRRGGRGCRGCRCSRRVRLLPRAAPSSRRSASPRAAPLPTPFFPSTSPPADGVGR